MTQGVGGIGGGGAVPVGLSPSGGALPHTAVDSSFSLPSVGGSVHPVLQNPRVVIDPKAGLITQYMDSSQGQVVLQIPSSVAVAYLRLGLTADGLSKPEEAAATPVKTTTA